MVLVKLYRKKSVHWNSAALVLAGILTLSCAKNSQSSRDARREQLRNGAETKRRELQIVAGEYNGVVTQNSGVDQNATLQIEIKDIPETEEGKIDPVLIPVLKGFLRFNLGSGGSGAEYIGFSIEKADFDPRKNKLDLVVSNPDYKEMVITCILSNSKLDGAWSAPSNATSGEIHLDKKQTLSGSVAEQLRGEYSGVFFHEGKNLYQYAQLTLATSIKPPEGLKVTGSLRIIYGALGSTEYLTYKFDPVQFNPMTGQIVFKNEANDVLLSGYWSKGEFRGDWFSTYTGRVGAAVLKKDTIPGPQAGFVLEPLKGTYQGKFTNNGQGNLPERMMISFVTSQDLNKPNGISVTGSVRFYLGPFGSTEYVEYPFTDVQFNFFTRHFTARTSGDYKFTLKAETKKNEIWGTVAADALGEVGKFEVTKQ